MNAGLAHSSIVTACYKNAASVERAYRAALALGYHPSDISLAMSEETRTRHFRSDQGAGELIEQAAVTTEKKHPAAQELGGPTGGTAATLAPAVIAAGAAALVPGLIVAGPVAIALAAAAAAGMVGGLAGALTHWGVPKSRMEQYESYIRYGGILIGVKPRSEDDARELQRQWHAAGAESVQH